MHDIRLLLSVNVGNFPIGHLVDIVVAIGHYFAAGTPDSPGLNFTDAMPFHSCFINKLEVYQAVDNYALLTYFYNFFGTFE